jgi:transposase
VGVDPHADTLAASGTDAGGVEVFHLEVPNTAEGIGQLIDRVNSFEVRWAIEGTGTYGRQLCDRLLTLGSEVVEVPTRVTAIYRLKQGNRKTDQVDAVAIARAGLRDDCHRVAHLEVVETLRVLVTQRKALVEAQVQQVNRLRARLRELDPSSMLAVKRLRSKKAMGALIEFVETPTGNPLEAALQAAIRTDCCNWLTMYQQIKDIEKTIGEVMPPAGVALTNHLGIGLVGAATILAYTGDINRFPTEGHYASFCGTAPVDASSGRQQRHRLNRWGNRQINHVLHVAILTQIMRGDKAAEYINRRMDNNSTKKDAIRAAKRKLNRALYKTLKKHPL